MLNEPKHDPEFQSPVRVLIVEDDPIGRDLMARVLSRSGYQPMGAGTVEEALRMARSCPPQVLVADWLLPDGTGLEISEKIRGSHPGTAVIFLSGFSCEELRAEACHLRPAAILRKPVAHEHLLQAIEEAVSVASR